MNGDENTATTNADKSTEQEKEKKRGDTKPNGAAAEEPANGDNKKENAKKETAGEGKSGSKRKLDEDSEKPADPDAEEASKEVGGDKDELEDAPGDIAEGEIRARKRTKTAEGDEKAAEEK